jgi:hypothetical protein
VARVADVLKAATNARWPMYLRNVKQLLRAADGTFDERRYGFAGLVELVRGCQKEGLVRLERDRRGGLRVFPGPALQRPGAPREDAVGRIDGERHVQPDGRQERNYNVAVPSRSMESEPGQLDAGDGAEGEVIDTEPMPTVDPTAELLGTASRRKRPARATAAAAVPAVRGGRAAPPRKPAARKAAPRSRKSVKSE